MQSVGWSGPNEKVQIAAAISDAFDAHYLADTVVIIHQSAELLLQIGW